MPNDSKTGVVELDQYSKDKDEFESAVDEILAADDDKTDDEIIKDLDDKKDTTDKPDEASGDAPKDPDKSTDSDKSKTTDSIDDLIAADQGGVKADAIDPDTSNDKVSDGDWQQRAELAEAKLKKEQQKTASWNGRITKANQRVIELEAKVKELEDKAPSASDDSTDSDTEVLERFRKDFPELGNVVDVLQKRIDKNAPAATAKDPEPAAASPDAAYVESNERDTAMLDIRKVHPDLDEMVSTGVLLTWINQQADYMRPHLDQIYKNGTPNQVIDMVTRFKESSSWKSQLDIQGSDKKKSKQEKLDALKEVNSESGGEPAAGPDKNDYDGAAKEAGL